MTERRLREILDAQWNRLEAQPPSGPHRMRISELPVNSAKGPLGLAVDIGGFHHLLVPVDSQQKVRQGLDGPVLFLRKRPLEGADTYQTYADLACLRTDLNDVFTGLCTAVLERAEAEAQNPVKALYTEIDRWRSLFQTKGGPLGIGQQAALFAELTVLLRLLKHDPRAHRFWAGPSGYRHDFSAGRRAIEIKASIATEGRRIRIHGLDQLQPPRDGILHLAWFRLERASSDGMTLAQLTDQAIRVCEEESDLRTLLAQAGYSATHTEIYQAARFVVTEERWYEVNATFPKLTGNDLEAAGIPIVVTDVHYTVDLTNEPPTPLDGSRMNHSLLRLIEEAR